MEATKDTAFAIVAELSIVAFFFAMRSCEISLTPSPGRTRVIRLSGVVFRDAANREIDHHHKNLADAVRVTVTFEDQKNGTKMDRRTHQRTRDAVLCPVKCLAALVARIHRRVPNASPSTTLDTMVLVTRETRVTSNLIRQHLRSSCTALGGKEVFGYAASDIGTKSLRSGAAMSLFLMNHSVHKQESMIQKSTRSKPPRGGSMFETSNMSTVRKRALIQCKIIFDFNWRKQNGRRCSTVEGRLFSVVSPKSRH